jgi:hypothetical protein
MFRRIRADETILAKMKPFSAFGASRTKRRMVIKPWKTAAQAEGTRRHQMRALSFILAVGFVLAGSSLAGTSDSGLPGVGTFAYSGSPVAAKPILVASRL